MLTARHFPNRLTSCIVVRIECENEWILKLNVSTAANWQSLFNLHWIKNTKPLIFFYTQLLSICTYIVKMNNLSIEYIRKIFGKKMMKMHVKPNETFRAKAVHEKWFKRFKFTLNYNNCTVCDPTKWFSIALECKIHDQQKHEILFYGQKKLDDFGVLRKCKWNAMMYAFAYFESHCRFNFIWVCMMCVCLCT